MELNSIELAVQRVYAKFEEQPRAVRKQVVDLVVQYLFRAINYRRLNKEVKLLISKVKVSSILESVTHKGYILKNIKMWLFHAIKRSASFNSRSLQREFLIERQDRNLGTMLSDKTLAYLAKMARKYKGLSLVEIDKVMSNIALETNVWVRKFLNKKLLFIMRSQKIPLQDLQNEILIKGMRGLYLMLPMVESPLHATNIVKRTLRQRGLNLIAHYTTQKRAIIVRDTDKLGFHSNTVSLDSFEGADRERVLGDLIQEMTKHDLSIDIRRFFSALKCEKKKRFVGLLMGVGDADFSAYLKKERLLTRYEELSAQRFMEVCFDFLEVPKTKGWRFVQNMQQHFISYSAAAT